MDRAIEIELNDDDYSCDRVIMNSDIEIRGEMYLDRTGRVSIEVDEIAPAAASAA